MNFINLLKRPDLPLSNPKYSTTAMNALERVGIIWISNFYQRFVALKCSHYYFILSQACEKILGAFSRAFYWYKNTVKMHYLFFI